MKFWLRAVKLVRFLIVDELEHLLESCWVAVVDHHNQYLARKPSSGNLGEELRLEDRADYGQEQLVAEELLLDDGAVLVVDLELNIWRKRLVVTKYTPPVDLVKTHPLFGKSGKKGKGKLRKIESRLPLQ